MMRSLWTAKTGLEAQQRNVDVISNNLANVSTQGFKKSRAIFQDLLYQTERQPGSASSQQTQLPTGYQVGTGSIPVATARIHTQGNVESTGNDLDVSINGNGFFQIQLPDGTIGYTRNGSFQRDSQGNLVNANGFLLQPQITVPLGTTKLTISDDGIVNAFVSGNAQPQQIGQITIADFINPAGLQSQGGSIYVETVASGAPTVGNPGAAGTGLGTLAQGFVETSNVNVVEELVSLIQTQRAYDINSKAVQTADQMLAKLSQF